MAVSDLFIWDFKKQLVTIPLTDSSEFNCWGEALVCERLNDPTDPTYIAELAKWAAKEELERQNQE
jgi:hypothetical protein